MSSSRTVASLFSESTPARLIAVTLLPSLVRQLETTIIWGRFGCWKILVRMILYSSLARFGVVERQQR